MADALNPIVEAYATTRLGEGVVLRVQSRGLWARPAACALMRLGMEIKRMKT